MDRLRTWVLMALGFLFVIAFFTITSAINSAITLPEPGQPLNLAQQLSERPTLLLSVILLLVAGVIILTLIMRFTISREQPSTSMYAIMVATAAVLLLAVSLQLVPRLVSALSNPNVAATAFAAVVTVSLTTIGVVLFYYLSRPGTVSIQREDTPEWTLVLQQLQELRRSTANTSDLHIDVEKLRKEIEKLSASRPTDISLEDRAAITQRIIAKINETLTNDFIKAIDAKYSSAILQATETSGLIEHFDSLKNRLVRAIGYLEQRANVNLIIGIVTTLGAIAGLYYIVFLGSRSNFDTLSDVLTHYLPRISFVIFIELFSYFFLRLYKANVDDVKYYHNELTNVDSKLIALRASMVVKDDATLKAIATVLSKTERNYILKRGETTVDIEKYKLESKGITDGLKQAVEVVRTATKQAKA